MIYADYNGSAPLKTVVTDYLVERLKNGNFSNPNATHLLGKKVMYELEYARRRIANCLNCTSEQIIFNSGSSEGISQIFNSILGDKVQGNKKIIITSGIEHAAIYQCCDMYQEKGYRTIIVKTTEHGVVDTEDLKKIITQYANQIALVTIMAANNETGIVQPYQAIGKLCQENELIYFSDTTQFIGKTEFDFENSYMDFAVLSSHKIGALIGSGCIIAKDKSLLKPLILGGGQERSLRGGTQNYISIETIPIALEYFLKNLDQLKKVSRIRETFEQNIKSKFPRVVIIGEAVERLATTTLISLPGTPGQTVQAKLESQGIMVTTSSACSDSKSGSSKVLKSMNLSEKIGMGVVRISLCLNANQELYDQIEKALTLTYQKAATNEK